MIMSREKGVLVSDCEVVGPRWRPQYLLANPDEDIT
jgi:hypothetical protein